MSAFRSTSCGSMQTDKSWLLQTRYPLARPILADDIGLHSDQSLHSLPLLQLIRADRHSFAPAVNLAESLGRRRFAHRFNTVIRGLSPIDAHCGAGLLRFDPMPSPPAFSG